jgi:lipopolysaccharide transport system ATP-binding protein
MSDIAIQVEDISKKYDLGSIGAGTIREALAHSWDRLRGRNGQANGVDKEFWALKDINFEVKQGEVVGIIGKNGAGKSTLLKVLSRITEPTTGQIRMKGRLASLLEVGTGFHPELTGRENIFLNGSILGMGREEIRRKFDEIVAFSGVEKFLDTPVKRYSSGMYVRLAFAVAAHLEPEILVIDEVLAVGDAEFQKKCLGKMKDVAGEGRTVLFVSHNMGAVTHLCSRCILLAGGEVKYDGRVRAAVDIYLNAEKAKHESLVQFNLDGKEIGIKRIELFNSAGEKTNQFRFGEPISIRLLVASQHNLNGMNINIGIDTASDQRIFTSVSDEGGYQFDFKAEEVKEIEAIYNNTIFNPGQYMISVSVRMGKKIFFQTGKCLSVVVVDNPFLPEQIPFKGNWGILRINPTWKETIRV